MLVGATPVTVLFAPIVAAIPTRGLLVLEKLLSGSRKQLDLALFVLSEQRLADVMARLQGQGVAIRLLADPGFANRAFSEVLDLLGTQLPDHRCGVEAANRLGSAPGECRHTTPGQRRQTAPQAGYHRQSHRNHRLLQLEPSAAHQNDETLLVFESPCSPSTSPLKSIGSGKALSSASPSGCNASKNGNAPAAAAGCKGDKREEVGTTTSSLGSSS